MYSEFITIIENSAIDATPASNQTLKSQVTSLQTCNTAQVKSPRRKTRYPPAPRLNQKCDQLVAKRKEALDIFLEDTTWNNFIKYKRVAAITKRGLRKIKKESFPNLSISIDKSVNPTRLWALVRKFENRWKYTEKCHEYKREKIESAKELVNELCPLG